MEIVAILGTRNERTYIANALTYLIRNGLRFAVIDNESTDGTAEIVQSDRFRDHLVYFKTLAFNGSFDLEAQLRAKREAIQAIKADWLIHMDADEIMHSYYPDETLHDSIARLSATGAEVINFDEFVFLPIEHDYVPDTDHAQPMRHYYFFEPRKMRLMRAWKASEGISIMENGGHHIKGDFKIAEESFALRHYIFRDLAHAQTKYINRQFSKTDVKRGWHRNRMGFTKEDFIFPPARDLAALADPEDHALNKAQPQHTHYWQWHKTPPRPGL